MPDSKASKSSGKCLLLGCKQQAKKLREIEKSLKILADGVRYFLALLDREYSKPAGSPADKLARGRRIARMCNELGTANDHIRYFNLGIDFRQDKPVDLSRPCAKQIQPMRKPAAAAEKPTAKRPAAATAAKLD